LFQDAGAEIVYNHCEAFRRVDLVIKIMPPTEAEVEYLEEGSVLLSSLELGVRSQDAMRRLIQAGVTAMGYEILEDERGELPVLIPMSEITGNLLPILAAEYLMSPNHGKGVVLGGVAGLLAAKVVIVGAGVVGFTAARAFHALGARVVLMDRDVRRLRTAKNLIGPELCTQLAVPYRLERELKDADVLIGAVRSKGSVSPKVIDLGMLELMPRGGVVMDVSTDQGGCVEGLRPTDISDPVYRENDLTFFAVPNIPSMVPRAASTALSNVILSFVQLMDELGELGPDGVLRRHPLLAKGVYAHKGHCTHPKIAEFLDLPFAGPCCDF
jgi:alanine dehydrogenase